MRAGSPHALDRRAVGRFGPIVLAAYLLPMAGLVLHFALVRHTIDPATGRSIGLPAWALCPERARASTGAPNLAAPAGEHTHADRLACQFAAQLNGCCLIVQATGAPSVPCSPGRCSPAPATPARAGDLLQYAPKQSPPA